jgi:hypothetical protein
VPRRPIEGVGITNEVGILSEHRKHLNPHSIDVTLDVVCRTDHEEFLRPADGKGGDNDRATLPQRRPRCLGELFFDRWAWLVVNVGVRRLTDDNIRTGPRCRS